MKYTIDSNVPIFESTVIIDKVDQFDNCIMIHGREAPNDQLNLKNIREEWVTGSFGFVTSEVKELDLLDKMYYLSQIISFARQQRKPVEFLFLVCNSSFSIYYRNKKPSF